MDISMLVGIANFGFPYRYQNIIFRFLLLLFISTQRYFVISNWGTNNDIQEAMYNFTILFKLIRRLLINVFHEIN
jgi:hypothetical protein